jgi:hypothetical protein
MVGLLFKTKRSIMTNTNAQLRLHRRIIITAILSTSLFTTFLLSTTVSATDSNVVVTRFGKLTISKDKADEPVALFNGKVVSKGDEGTFLNIEKYLKLQKADVAVMSQSYGGSASMPIVSFIEITSPTAAREIVGTDANTDELKISQSGEHVTVDLGVNGKGKHEFLSYQDGKAWVGKNVQKTADVDDTCNSLYNSVYQTFVQNKECSDAPEEAGGMSTARFYASLQNNKRYNLTKFQTISKTSCLQGNSIKYSEFKSSVCSGR